MVTASRRGDAVTRAAVIALAFLGAPSSWADMPGTSSTDLFDSTQGTTIIAHDTIVDPINAFRTSGGFEDGSTLMRNGGLNSISFIEFDTAAIARIHGVRLFAHNDGAGLGFRRAMSRFRLLADTDDDGTFETQVVDKAINVDYAAQLGNDATDPTNLDLTLPGVAGPVASRHWRLEVTQGTNVGQFEGARLVELDAVSGADSVPGTVSTDLFDATLGTKVIAHDTIADPINAFRTIGGFENGNTLMRNGGLNSVSFIAFDTATVVSIGGVRLFAHNDGAGLGFRRAMKRFRLLADADNNGSFETQVVDTAINVNYANQPGNQATDPTNLDLTLLAASPVVSRHWRLEVTQGTAVGEFEGARLVELDALAFTGPTADLAVEATASPDPVAPGGQVAYLVTLVNRGPDTAPADTLVQITPGSAVASWAGTFFVSSTTDPSLTSASCGFTPPSLELTCNFFAGSNAATIAPGRHTFRVLANVAATAANGPLTSTIRVTSSITEANPGDESVNVTVQVVRPATPPLVAISRPAAALTTLAKAATLRGSASDNAAVQRVAWENVDGASKGTATGTDLGDPSWIARKLPLAEGMNRIRVTAYDDEGTPSTPAQLEVLRVPEAQALTSLRFGDVPIVTAGQLLMDEPVLAAPGTIQAEIDVRLAVTVLHVLLNGEALSATHGTGNTFTAAVDVSRLPRDVPAGPGTPVVYRLSAVAELADGTVVTIPVTRGGQRLRSIPVRVDSQVQPVAAENAQSLWTMLPTFPSGPIQDLAVDAAGGAWVVAGSPLQISTVDSTEVVGSEIRYVTQVVGSSPDNALWRFDGSSWRRMTPSDLGLPPLLFTAVAVDATTLWIGTDRGLAQAQLQGAAPPLLVSFQTPTDGLVGSWVSSLRSEPGRLLVGHRGSRFYRLHANAVKRHWLDAGGVSVRTGTSWSAYAAERRDDGGWDGVAGFDVVAVAPAGPGGFWAASEAGLSRFDGSFTYENPSTGLPLDGVTALDAAGPGEVWAAGAAGVAWLENGSWARFVSDPDGLPGGAVRDLRIDNGGRVFFATASGVASFDPSSRLWSRHAEAGLGDAGALAIGANGRTWTAVDVGGQGTVSVFDVSLGVTLDAPADDTRFSTDATGLATVNLGWAAKAGAEGYEVFLDGALLGRTTATSRTLALRAGDHAWTVRALLAGGVAGPKSLARSFRVGEARDLGDAEVLLIHRMPGGVARVLDVFREPGMATWQAFGVAPHFMASDPSAIDLAASADGRLASANSANGQSVLEEYPGPLVPAAAPRATDRPLRVDVTSEAGGYVAADVTGGAFFLYNRLQGQGPATPVTAPLDVAGLGGGRVAVLDGSTTVRVFERTEPSGPVSPAQVISLSAEGPNARAIAALPDGGFAILGAALDDEGDEVVTYDAALARRSSIPIVGPAASAGPAADLAADEEGRIFVLVQGAAGPAVYMTRDAGPSPAWTPVPVSLPSGGSAATAIAAYLSPAPRAARESTPDDPPVMPGASFTLPGTDVFVHAPSGFTSCLSNNGPIWILGFLRTDGPLGCDSATAPTRLTGTGLFLDYNAAGYGSLPTSAPTGTGALPLVTGAFTLSLQDGRITGTLALSLGALGNLTSERLGVLGMGEYQGATQRKGIGLGDGRTVQTFGAFNLALEFSQLFLTDVGGAFHKSFGGIDGLLAPYDEGSIGFPGVPLRFRTTGDLTSTTCALSFASVRTEVLSPLGAVLFPLQLAGLCINQGVVSFGTSTTNFEDIFDLTINGGSITTTGVDAESASLTVENKTFAITGIHVGSDGFRFARAPGLELEGISAEMQDVTLLLPGPGQSGSFSAGLANLSLTSVAGRLDQLNVPFEFFRSPPAAFPTAQGGLLRIGPEADPHFRVDIQPGLKVAPGGITIPAFSLSTRKPAFSLNFAGGQITRQFVELNDVPPVNISAFSTSLDFERIRLGRLATGGDGFFTSKADITAGPVRVTLRDFSIDTTGRIDISGGGFQKAGFAFDVTRNPAPGSDLAFRASFSFKPIINNARGDVRISNGKVNLDSFTFDQLTLGPLRVKDPLLRLREPEIEFGATVGFGSFPDVSGRVLLNNGGLTELSLAAQFPQPGYQLFGGMFLQQLSGQYNRQRQELNADVLISGGPKLSFPPFAPGPYYLVTLKGAVTVSGLGYFQTSAELRLLQGPGFGGFLIGQSTAIVGNVYLNGQFVGVGMYFKGNVLLFGGILNVGMTAWVYPPLGGVLTPGPQQGTYGGDLRGTLQIPPAVPLIGGLTFGQANVALRGTFQPPRASFSGSVSIPLCTPPIYWCTGIRWCQACGWVFGWRICSPPYPCGLTGCGWKQACWPINVGFRIDESGFHAASRSLVASAGDAGGFDRGYRQENGLTVFTNYRLGGSASAAYTSRSSAAASTAALAQGQVSFTVPEGVPQAIIRMDFSNRTGDAHLSVRFPDGRVFTKDNTPEFTAASTANTPNAGDMLIFYRHQVHEADPADPNDRPLKEAAFLFRGAFEFRSVSFTDADGNPTGEVGEYFAPGNVPPGVYEVTVESTGDAGDATVELLLGNSPPRLTGSVLKPTVGRPDHYRLEWTADDPDGDPVTVRLHLGTDVNMPEFSQPLGDQAGYTLPGGATSFEFDLRTKEFLEQNISAPLQLFVSLEDGFNERLYVNVATLDPPVSEKAPPQVTGVVARPREDAVEVYWDPVAWTPPAPSLILSSYGVVVQEIGPAGTVGPPLTRTVSAPAPGSGDPVVTEAVVGGIAGGRRYRISVSAVGRETLAGAGPPLCPCNPPSPPLPGETCFDPPVACDTPTDLTVEHAGRASAPVIFTAPTGAVNSPPRFLSVPGPIARLGEAYVSPIRVEDPDGDAVSLQLCGCRTLDTDPPRTSCEPPLGACDPPTPAGLQIVEDGAGRLLAYAPAQSGLGRHVNALLARDGRGGESVQQFGLEVVHFGSSTARAVFTSEPPGSVVLGETFVYQIEVTGLSPSVVPRFTLASGPEGMAVDAVTGLVTWVPGPGDLGGHTVTLEVVDADPTCSTCGGEGIGTQTFTVQVLPNPLGNLGPVLSVTPSARSVGPETGFADFEVANAGAGSFSWTAAVEPGSEWLTILQGGSGDGGGFIRLAVAANPGENPRTGTLRVDAAAPASGSPRRVTVQQEGARLAVLAVSPGSVTTHDRRAGRFEIAIRNAGGGTLEWSAVVLSGTAWLGLEGGFDENNGVGDGRIVVTYMANPAGPSRTGVVRIQSRTARSGQVDVEVSQVFELFKENAAPAGLDTPGAKEGGLVFCDLNDDGWPDALVNTRSDATEGRSRVYFNDGQGRFTDVTSTHAAGLLERRGPRSAICGDLNNDGRVDFARNSAGRVEIYLNRGPQGDPPWSFGGPHQRPSQVIDRLRPRKDDDDHDDRDHDNDDRSSRPEDENDDDDDEQDDRPPHRPQLRAEGMAFLDHDNDGDLDLLVDADVDGLWIFPNDGRGRFDDSSRFGLDGGRHRGDYLAVADYDRDGDVDVLSRRDGSKHNLWTNTGGGRFKGNGSFDARRSRDGKSGVAFCDFDRDGDLDVLWGDPAGSEIWRNQFGRFEPTGEPAASSRTTLAGVRISGVACGDVDNDGDVDLFLAASSGPGFLFLNDTPAGHASPLAFRRDNSGIDVAAQGKGIVLADFDRDGDLDLLVNVDGAANQLWVNHRNESGASDYLAVRAVRCLDPGRTRDDIGATVRLFEADGTTPAGPAQEVSGGSGLGSQGAAIVQFGLPGGAERRYVLEVRFLDSSQRHGRGGTPLVIRREVVPAQLGAYQLVEVESCKP